MIAAAEHSDDELTPRELRASRAADKQGLALRKSAIRCHPCRYELVYSRYNQLVANDLELDDVEDWLGLHRRRQ